jgi:Do/DeqQ family serine protease
VNSLKLVTAAFAGALAALVLLPFVQPAPADAAPAASPAPAPAPAPVAAPKPTPVGNALPAQVQGQRLPSLAPIIKQAGPAVVGIATRGTQAAPYNPFMDDPFFRRFFGAPPQQPRERETRSQGSGVIVDAAKGYVVTNHHVVEGADEIAVSLQDGRTLKAKLVGSDERTDLAVVQVPAGKLTALALGDSDRLEVGDFVIAIGNPFGLDHTVTSGIVSALGRRGLNEENYEDFIQTDAAINPGNSGGALIDLDGRLIGINAAIISRSGGNMGIGFAIPVDMVKSVMQQLIAHGEVQRGMLGVTTTDVPPELAADLGVPDGAGAVVNSVTPESAAAKAGIQPGDVIVAVDGKPVAGSAELRNRIGLLRTGQKVKVDLVRDGKARSVTATIAKLDPEAVAAAESLHAKLAGAAFGEIDERSPFYGRLKGVLVLAVEPDSNAARRARLQAGDVITGVNRRPVNNLAEFQRAMGALPDEAVFALNIRRGNMTMFVTVP